MSKCLERFIKDESGATAIEYGLIAAGISVAIAVVQGLGTNLKSTFGSVRTALAPAAQPHSLAAELKLFQPRYIRGFFHCSS